MLALAGCNQVYGLDATQLRDGAAPDAPFACTSAAPQFRGTPVPVIASSNSDLARFYSISLDRRIAVTLRAGTLYEGPGDSDQLRGAMLMPPPPAAFNSPRLSPEGDELFLVHPESPATASIVRYARSGDVWIRQPSPAFTVPTSQPEISIPTRKDLGPRHVVVTVGAMMREYIETAPDVWSLTTTYAPSDFGTMNILVPNLSADGLRIVFQGQGIADATLYYATRERIDARFGMAVDANPFFGNPRLLDPYLLEDCSRLYFFVLQNPVGVFYAER